MKEWLANASVNELLAIRKTILGLTDEQCKKEREVYIAIAKGRLLSIFSAHQQKQLIAEGLSSIEYDPVLDWEPDEDGKMFPALRRSDELNPDRQDSILGFSFKWKVSHYLLECVTSLTSDGAELPQFITPTIDLRFLQKKVEEDLLRQRWDEAYRCRRVSLVMAGAVMLVSFMEGLLGIVFLEALSESEKEHYGRSKDRKGVDVLLGVEKWTLEMLMAAGQGVLGINKANIEMLRMAQKLRNDVHPLKAREKDGQISVDDLDSIWLSAQHLVPVTRRFLISRRETGAASE